MIQIKTSLPLLILSFLVLFRAETRAALVIMPLGDSITEGGGAGNPTNQSGYRDQLFTDLNNENIAFSFTGTSTNYASPQLIAAGDQYHNGKSGYTLGDIDSNLTVSNGTPEIFGVAADPNVVLLMGDERYSVQRNRGSDRSEHDECADVVQNQPSQHQRVGRRGYSIRSDQHVKNGNV